VGFSEICCDGALVERSGPRGASIETVRKFSSIDDRGNLEQRVAVTGAN
jgi:hypothetical protein